MHVLWEVYTGVPHPNHSEKKKGSGFSSLENWAGIHNWQGNFQACTRKKRFLKLSITALTSINKTVKTVNVLHKFSSSLILTSWLRNYITIRRTNHGKNNLNHTEYILWTLCDEH